MHSKPHWSKKNSSRSKGAHGAPRTAAHVAAGRNKVSDHALPRRGARWGAGAPRLRAPRACALAGAAEEERGGRADGGACAGAGAAHAHLAAGVSTR
jgi:hypothetical protein